MCKLCQRTPCSTGCPNRKQVHLNYMKRHDTDHCVYCGDSIVEAEGHYERHGFPYCESCVARFDSDFLLRICGIPIQEYLRKLGFVHIAHH